MRQSALRIAILAGFTLAGINAQTPPGLRLPDSVVPLRYDLDLRLFPQEEGYTGRVGIDVEVKRATPVIWLHSRGLTITQATVGSAKVDVLPAGVDFLGLNLSSPTPAGKTRIELEFSGKFSLNDVEGLFRQTDAGNNYVFTQFEPTSARNAFPCFDEPSLKVPWKLTLRVPRGIGAFANTPVLSEGEEGGAHVVRFFETKPLPSYLVAVAVGPFDVVEGPVAGRRKIPTRILAMKGRGAEAAYARDVTPKVIAALEDYFGQPYPYEKLDQVAIPITVGFGAMENAGLITYQQTILLARKDDDTITRQRSSTGTITHELAHQWFGNMVTPAWWDDIWLNEAFATWMASKTVDRLFPAWNQPASAIESKERVMNSDSLTTARKIRQPIVEPGDIGNAFDGITYQKGAAVIRMFENYVGADRFQRGVQSYMKKHMWGNATATDFLASISAAAGKDIAPAFSKFLDRGGVPLLTVELKCDGAPRLLVQQERSLPVGSKGVRAEFWSTPVCLRWEANGKESKQCVVLSDPKEEIALKGASSCPAWITANDQGAGYYQVRYEGDLAKRLASNGTRLSLAERVDLLRNALALVSTGQMPADQGLALAREFRKGPERQVISASLELVESVRTAVAPEMRPAYANLIRTWYGPEARRLGWRSKPGESQDMRLLRPQLMEAVGILGDDPELGAQARELAGKWMTDRNAVEADISGSMLKVAAHHGDRAFYEELLKEARKSGNLRERKRIVDAIGAFGDPEIARQALGILLTGELDVREVTSLLENLQNDPETEMLPWTFVKNNYDRLLPRLPSRLGAHGGSILPKAGASFCSSEGYEQVGNFFRERIGSIEGGKRPLAQTLEKIQLCAARVPVQRPEVSRFLKQNPGE